MIVACGVSVGGRVWVVETWWAGESKKCEKGFVSRENAVVEVWRSFRRLKCLYLCSCSRTVELKVRR